jgi:hypothetical protein
MAASTVESWLMRPVVIALNNVTCSVPPPEPPKQTWGMTHYTCLPSKSRPADYECKKGYDVSLDDQRHHPNPVLQVLIEDQFGVYHHKDVDELIVPSEKKIPYLACYYAEKARTECVKGQFKNPFEEGRVKYISVPSLMPSHEWYIKQRWPRARIVDDYSPMVSDLNKTDSKT